MSETLLCLYIHLAAVLNYHFHFGSFLQLAAAMLVQQAALLQSRYTYILLLARAIRAHIETRTTTVNQGLEFYFKHENESCCTLQTKVYFIYLCTRFHIKAQIVAKHYSGIFHLNLKTYISCQIRKIVVPFDIFL